MASLATSSPQLYGFLGNDLVESFIKRVFVAHGLDMETSAEYHDALFTSVTEQLDNFILEKLDAEDMQKMYLLKGSNAPQSIITHYLNTQIPNLTVLVSDFLDTVFDSISKKLQ